MPHRNSSKPKHRRTTTAFAPQSHGLRRWAPLLLLVVVGCVAYSESFSGVFLFDDLPSIQENEHLRQLSTAGQAAWGEPHTSLAHRPVVALSLALNYALGGYEVRGYHVVNLAAHLLSACLIFAIARRTLRAPLLSGRLTSAAPWLAMVISLVWVVHPLNTEAVMYITQRTTLFDALFTLLTLYASIRTWDADGQAKWRLAAWLACALGMASKETMVTVPLLIPLYDRAFFCDSWRALWQGRKRLYGGLAATWGVLVLLLMVGPTNPTVGNATGVSSWEYLITQAGVILHYLRLSVWPQPLVLAYDWDVVRSLAQGLVPVAIVATLVLASLWACLRRPAWGWLGAWFFLLLAPTSSVLPIATELIAERRMYLALLSVLVAGTLVGDWVLQRLAAAGMRRPTLAFGAVALLAVTTVSLATLTRERVRDYHSGLGMWSDTVAKCPRNAVAQNNLGCELRDRGRFEEALQHYDLSLAIQPNPVVDFAHNNRGSTLFQLGRVGEAIEEYRQALAITADYAEAHSNLAYALSERSRLAEADRHSLQALRLKPGLPDVQTNRGVVLARQRRFPEAETHFREAARLAPGNFLAHYNLGLALAAQNRLDHAAEAFRASLELNPSLAAARQQLNRIEQRLSSLEPSR